jgi:hypothetical protein
MSVTILLDQRRILRSNILRAVRTTLCVSPRSFQGALTHRRLKTCRILSILVLCCSVGLAAGYNSQWRPATGAELKKIIPSRAPVGKENIETELRTASGVTDGHNKFIAGVVMITAGYSAEGKYSHFLITQVPIRIGEMTLGPGEYVFGYQRVADEAIRVTFYVASSGERLGEVTAQLSGRRGPIRSLFITPPGAGKSLVQLGRFAFEYNLADVP